MARAPLFRTRTYYTYSFVGTGHRHRGFHYHTEYNKYYFIIIRKYYSVTVIYIGDDRKIEMPNIHSVIQDDSTSVLSHLNYFYTWIIYTNCKTLVD